MQQDENWSAAKNVGRSIWIEDLAIVQKSLPGSKTRNVNQTGVSAAWPSAAEDALFTKFFQVNNSVSF